MKVKSLYYMCYFYVLILDLYVRDLFSITGHSLPNHSIYIYSIQPNQISEILFGYNRIIPPTL